MKIVNLKKIELIGNDRKVYFSSDFHYSHKNICSGVTNWTDAEDVTRKFDTLEEMNDTIVNNINSRVGENDILICLGDWSFGGFENITLFRNRINCKTIYLIPGNHDHFIVGNRDNVRDIFTEIWDDITFLSIKEILSNKVINKYNFVLSHYPLASWPCMNDGWYHVHGHVHLPAIHKVGQGKSLDCGIDGNNYFPYELTEIDNILSNQPIRSLSLPQDHHEKRV
jgi:calcineurin-like phosphoesterase family protein